MKKNDNATLQVALTAGMTAVVVVFTIIVKIPTPTKGYLNLCDLAISFIAFTFSPLTAMLTAGLGTCLADILSGYPQWAPISLIVHGLEGLITALIVASPVQKKNTSGEKISAIRIIIAMIACIVIVAGGYFVLGAIFMSIGFGAAAAGIPGNIVQAGIGVIGGYILSRAVIKAYPPVRGLI
ncbi:MAG: ECF transporter S component [Treponema sp.]|jgi:uncharacterized membrane protein|nr:ECF transporter S component [Treponema sp.]